MRHLLFTCTLALAASSLLACDVTQLLPQDDGRGEIAIESAILSDTESSVVAALIANIDATAMAEDGASALAAAAGTTFTPADCVQAVPAAATVTYLFNNCSGPYGLTGLDGEAVATVSISGGSVSMNLASTAGLSANGDVMILDASAVLTGNQIALTTGGVGTSASGTVFTRSGSYTVDYDDATDCKTLTGTWASTVDDSEATTTTVSNYRTCGNGCPESGGNMTYASTDGTDDLLTIQFNGTDTVQYFGANGIVNLQLSCTSN